MKLITFSDVTGARIGLLDSLTETVVDLQRALPQLPRSMQQLIESAPDLDQLGAAKFSSFRLALSAVTVLAPIPTPRRNILCVGKNYHEHAREFHDSGFDASAGKSAVPDHPIIFTKWPGSVIGPNVAIDSSLDPTNSVDYEGELCVVIGQAGRAIPNDLAYRHVFGYTIVNDVTSRTLQNRHRQWFLGKSIDTFCPMGPCVVTADEIPDPRALCLQTRVNGELRQDALVSELIFDIPTLIEVISRSMTLLPGDLIATGTCAGVGIGHSPPKYLRRGDTVAVTIEPIGTLSNRVT